MSAPAIAGGPVLTIRGTHYPVLLPKFRDPRLHLAAVIITLQVLGQTAFGFSLSIAQILVAIGTCAVLEVGIAFFRQHVLMWPASALLTGNGVAFILRVPGTPHGDWWSLHGAWIFAGTAAVSLLSKHLIRWRGRHIFNPSNFGLVLCFLVLSESRAEPLDFWWGPMSLWLALAIALIVGGGLTILSRLRLLVIAGAFWLSFAGGIGVLAASGHSMTARWHLGPITGWSFWWLLVTSPEILIFLFFMITDPMTIPKGRVARVVYAVSVGLLATLLIAPQTTEYKTKVAVLGALALVCPARPLLERLLPAAGAPEDRALPWARGLMRHGWALTLAAAGFAGLVVVAGIPARPDSATASSLPGGEPLPRVSVVATEGISGRVDSATADRIAHDIVLDLRANADALRLRDPQRATVGAGGAWLVDLRRQIGAAAGGPISVSSYRISDVDLTLTRGAGQGPPRILASVKGVEQAADYRGRPPQLERRHKPVAFKRTLEVAAQRGHYVIVGVGGAAAPPTSSPVRSVLVRATGALGDVRLQDVASQVGLDFRQGAFRFGVSNDDSAMMGGGVCWLDYDRDGWLDLFVVNSFSAADRARWEQNGGLPRSVLFHNVKGSFVNVSRGSGAGLPVRGEGCVAADLNGDGYSDVLVTTSSYDELLWNNGDGTFTEGAKAAGIDSFGWHSGAAVADVDGDGRPDLFVAGYADLNTPAPNAVAGFPSNYRGVRDLLYLNEGNDENGHARFREVGVQAGLEATAFRHGLGALFTDYNGDGRPDLYVANDEDPNQLYENVAWPGGAAADPSGLGFRFEERGAAEAVDDPYAGMGIASGDYNGDGRLDLFVTNSRREPYAVYRRGNSHRTPAFRDGRSAMRSAYAGSAGWGASWVDLALNGRPDLVLASGDVPITSLAKDAAPIRVLSDLSADGSSKQFANVGVAGLRASPPVNGRGLAAADYDNNGTMDIAVGSIGGRLVLLRNTGGTGHWLEVAPARFSPGAVATVVLPDGRKLVQELHAGSSYLSSEDPRFHFGLGDATEARTLVVRFPDGRERRFSDVRADRLVVVKPPSARRAADVVPVRSYLLSNCSPAPRHGRSVARLWDETALAVDPGRANPPAQARNLFHLAAAMWDAWAAYDPKGDGYFVKEKHRAGDVQSAREAAISYAAYRLLLWRRSFGANVGMAFGRLTTTLRSLCYRPGFVSTRGDSPAALGNRIAAAAIAFGQHDGSLEREHYVDSSYVPVNEPLVMSQPGTPMHDRTFWQPLAFGQIVVKGGLPIAAKVQSFVGSQWGHVRGFALPASKDGLPIDPGAPPVGDPSSAAYKQAAVNAIRWSARRGGATIAARWNGRETAATRWNSIASSVSHGLASDVKLYFALNAALHDAAVATWGAKRTYQSVRPISMIRQLAFEDQLPLVPGLVESHLGDVAIRTANGWTPGTRWLPRSGIVTPPDPGWVADGSAFGRAAAEILTAETGSARYRRMADEEGISGLYAGTQIAADDIAGRRIGSHVGKRAWARAQRYFAGTAR